MPREVTGTKGNDTVQGAAFDPLDGTSGAVTFLDDTTLFFQQGKVFLFASGRDGVVAGTDKADGIGPGYTDAGGDAVDASDAQRSGAGCCGK